MPCSGSTRSSTTPAEPSIAARPTFAVSPPWCRRCRIAGRTNHRVPAETAANANSCAHTGRPTAAPTAAAAAPAANMINTNVVVKTSATPRTTAITSHNQATYKSCHASAPFCDPASCRIPLAAVTDETERDYVQRLAAQAQAAGDQTGWFEQLYQEAGTGAASVPWDDQKANPMLVSWPGLGPPGIPGSRAMVVGAGLGENAELLAS